MFSPFRKAFIPLLALHRESRRVTTKARLRVEGRSWEMRIIWAPMNTTASRGAIMAMASTCLTASPKSANRP
jgi:hypothetical protein